MSVARVRRFGEGAVATPANAITIARLLLAIPVLVLIADGALAWVAVIGWLVLACTDGLDGWLARRDGTTRSGAFLDPLADKILVLGGFGALAITRDVSWWAFLVVAVREIGISVYRSLAAKRGISLPARQLGKIKAVLQFAAVAIVLFPPFADATWLHHAAVWVAVAFTVASGLDIVRRGWQENRALEV